jgi:hypothetical protein
MLDFLMHEGVPDACHCHASDSSARHRVLLTSGALSVDVILASAWLIVKRIESEGVETTTIRTGIGFLILPDRLKLNPKNLKCGNWC